MSKKRNPRTGGSVRGAKGITFSDANTNNPATTKMQTVYSGQVRLGIIQECCDGQWLAVAADETLVGYYPTARAAARAFKGGGHE